MQKLSFPFQFGTELTKFGTESVQFRTESIKGHFPLCNSFYASWSSPLV